MHSNHGGFTLVEMVASIGVAIPMLILIMKLVPQMAYSTQVTTQLMIASHLSASHLDEIYRTIRSGPSGFSTDYTSVAAACDSPFSDYVKTVSDSADPSVKTISVHVWKDTNGNLTQDNSETGFTTMTHIAGY